MPGHYSGSRTKYRYHEVILVAYTNEKAMKLAFETRNRGILVYFTQ